MILMIVHFCSFFWSLLLLCLFVHQAFSNEGVGTLMAWIIKRCEEENRSLQMHLQKITVSRGRRKSGIVERGRDEKAWLFFLSQEKKGLWLAFNSRDLFIYLFICNIPQRRNGSPDCCFIWLLIGFFFNNRLPCIIMGRFHCHSYRQVLSLYNTWKLPLCLSI